jgi:hypothetical protein
MPVSSVVVPLTPETAQALRDLARRELRDPRLQARWLLETGLRQAGVLVMDPPTGGDDDPRAAAPEQA